jgi:hypothetical protein
MRHFNAIGPEQFSPGQALFRLTNRDGRWATDPTVQAVHTAYNVDCNSDGTIDMIRLEAGLVSFADLGGKGAYDVRAGRI